ncbi:MAG: haloacid dehalogenase type II [Vulcanimicrobiaceae bacterium]
MTPTATLPYDAYVFDLYGTLVDYASLATMAGSFVADPVAFVATWRSKQIATSFAATLMDRYVDFDDLTQRAFDYAAALHGATANAASRGRAIAAWGTLPPYADAIPAVTALRERGAKTAILSNGTPRGIAEATGNAKLAGLFDAILSVDAVRKYKPHPSVYALATDRFALAPERIAFVSSNGWDATGAAEFGFAAHWCDRAGVPAETFGRAPVRIVSSLAELLS